MSDRTDERVTTLQEVLDDHDWRNDRDGFVDVANAALASLAADAAETQTLREQVWRCSRCQMLVDVAETFSHFCNDEIKEVFEERDAAVAETQRLREQVSEASALTRELATMLGPITPHHGLSNAALWIEKVGQALIERDAAAADRERLAEAAGPFRQFADMAVEVDEDAGQTHAVWVKRMGGERVCDWFGPSDFATIAAALAGREGSDDA